MADKDIACTNHCIVGPLSPNFFPGCTCKSYCATNNCPCRACGRECDPDFCKDCQTCTDPMGVPADKTKQKCRNDNLRMHRQIEGLYVNKSTIPEANWGLFCENYIRRGSYIGEVRNIYGTNTVDYCHTLYLLTLTIVCWGVDRFVGIRQEG